MGEMLNAYKVLVGKREGKRPLGRPRHRWENIKMDLTEIGWCSIYWIHMAEDRDQCRKILEYLGDWWVLRKASASWSWLISVIRQAVSVRILIAEARIQTQGISSGVFSGQIDIGSRFFY
jgi:hypothetical protein